jgi:hypothetical protein
MQSLPERQDFIHSPSKSCLSGSCRHFFCPQVKTCGYENQAFQAKNKFRNTILNYSLSKIMSHNKHYKLPIT